MKKILYLLSTLICILLLANCKPGASDSQSGQQGERKVFEDTLFTQKFIPSGDRFTGGDGTYSVVLPDGRTLWIFGDSFIGGVTTDYKRVKTTPAYIRNCFITFENDKLITHQQGDPKEFKSMVIPPEVADGSSGKSELAQWYWPGDAFIEGGKLNVFVSKFSQENPDDMWGFNFLGTELAEFSLPDLKPLRVDRFPDVDSVHYGHAICETDDYLYIYGLKNKFPYAARTKRENVRGDWQFFNGKDWVSDPKAAAPLLEFSGSEQFSVFNLNGTYVMIMQEGGFGRKIYSFTSSSPVGPWGNQQMIYEIPPLAGCESCFTYNAVAHPQFTEDNFLLISYNTNSMKLQDHYENALIYRPRFIRVPLEKILP